MAWLVILLLIALNAYFSLAEIALVAVRKDQLSSRAEKGVSAAAKALRLSNAPEEFLSAVQVGITLLSLLEGIYGGDLAAQRLEPLLARAGLHPWLAHSFSLVLGIGLITYFTIVLGELLPKSVALQAPLRVSLAIAPSLLLFSKIAFPFIRLLTWSTRLLLRALKIKTQEQQQVTEDDIRSMLRAAYQQGTLQKQSLWLHQNVFFFEELTAGRMMKPLRIVRSLREHWSREGVEALMRRFPYSHFPVLDAEGHGLRGLLSTKQLFLGQYPEWQEAVRPALTVARDTKAGELFGKLTEKREDVAVVVSRQGRPLGIVTMQDIMEGIFGDIPELETYNDFFFQRPDGRWQAHGLVHLQRIRRRLNLLWLRDYETEYLSVGELLEGELGHSPAAGDSLVLHGLRFTVAEVAGRELTQVLLELPPEEAPDPAASPGSKTT